MLRRSLRLCSRGPDVDLPTFKKLILHSAYNQASGIPPQQQDFVLVDIRRDDELAAEDTAPGAVHVPLSDLQEVLVSAVEWNDFRRKTLEPKRSGGALTEEEEIMFRENDELTQIGAPGEKNVVFFCRAGHRTLVAMVMADAFGYNCCHVARGWSEYQQDPLGDDEIAKFVADKKERALQDSKPPSSD